VWILENGWGDGEGEGISLRRCRKMDVELGGINKGKGGWCDMEKNGEEGW
jgi:hypothetical protein